MKKYFLFFAALCCAITLFAETSTVLYEHQDGDPDLAVNWNRPKGTVFAFNQLSTPAAGDFLQVTVHENGASQYPSTCISSYNSWTNLLGTCSFSMKQNDDQNFVFRFGITPSGLAQMQLDSFYVNGAGFNLLKVEHISMESTEDLSNTIWFGNMVCSWSGINLIAGNFASAEEGWTLRVHHTDLGKNAKMALMHNYKAITGHEYALVNGDFTDYILTQNILDTMATGNFRISAYNLTLTQVELIAPLPETKVVTVRTTLWEGSQVMAWSQLCSMASFIPQIEEGDSIYVSVSEKDPKKEWQQFRLAWGNAGYVGFACYNDTEFPRVYALQVVDTMVTQMRASNKLYLTGSGVTVTKVVLANKKEVSTERGNAATTVWSGSQSINWSGTNEWKKLEASSFTAAKVGDRLRMNFNSMKLGAQGHIVDGNWKVFADANTFEKLPTAWGDYYEYTITQSMLDSLQERGLVVSGIGYTLISVQLIDPMKEYVVSTTFDTDDIRAWETTDGTPNLSITFQNYEEDSVKTSIDVSLMTDMFVDFNTYTQAVELAAGETKTVDIEFPDLTPGFYRMSAKANDNAICTYIIGYNPTAIVSPNDAQADFWTFWDNWKTTLAAIPVNATLESYATDALYDVYVVTMQTVNDEPGGEPITIKSYYKQPVASGKRPCLVRFQGSDGGSSTLSAPTWVAPDDWCELIVSTRGQMLNRDAKYNYDFYGYGLGDNDRHYYRAAYLDCVRAIDFVKSRSEVDAQNIFAAGGSQGGCFTYVTAGLCPDDIRAIAPSITGHSDFVHTMEIVGWPTNIFNNWIDTAVAHSEYADRAAAKAALLAHQSYFDTKNFANRIKCPVITNFSLQDNTDGPHLNIAPYNLLNLVSDKEYSINPFKGHAAADDWNTTYMDFFKARVYEAPETPTAVEETKDQSQCQKFVRDGQLFILHDGREYSILGQITK